MSKEAAVAPILTATPDSTVAEKPILDYVPETLNRLALFLAKGFFSYEHSIVMDYIIKLNCIREEDLRNFLKVDQKYLRQLLVQLKQDKLVKEKQASEEFEGRQRKFAYYFPNYRAIVNVAKYKIDHMRQRLEAREKTQTHRASYKCSGCAQSYTDFDMDKIFDPATETLHCWRCSSIVEADESVGPSTETRSSLAKFNQQMTSIFSLVQQLDEIQLAPHLFEPKLPAAMAPAQNENNPNQPRARVGERAYKATDANRSEMFFNTEQGMRVVIDDAGGEVKEKAKAAVPWLAAAAHKGAEMTEVAKMEDNGLPPPEKKIRLAGEDLLGLLKEEMDNPSASQSPTSQPPRSASVTQHEEEQHSRSMPASAPGVQPYAPAAPVGPTDFSALLEEETAHADNEERSEGEDEHEEFVHVQGVRHHLDDITTELVQQMTESEKAAYTELMKHGYDF